MPNKLKAALRDTAIASAEEAAEDACAAHRAASMAQTRGPQEDHLACKRRSCGMFGSTDGARAAAETGCSSKSFGIVAPAGVDIKYYYPQAGALCAAAAAGAPGRGPWRGSRRCRSLCTHSLGSPRRGFRTRSIASSSPVATVSGRQRDAESGQSQPSLQTEGRGGGGGGRGRTLTTWGPLWNVMFKVQGSRYCRGMACLGARNACLVCVQNGVRSATATLPLN